MKILLLVETYAQTHTLEFIVVFLCLVFLCMLLSAVSLAAMQRKYSKQNNRQTFKKEIIGGNKASLHNRSNRRA
jgi:hypothetical protein